MPQQAVAAEEVGVAVQQEERPVERAGGGHHQRAHARPAVLPGGRNGPSDAYRHSLASATVAYTASPRLVALVTRVMERDGIGSDMRAMDAHNNRIGARIGAHATSWGDMQDRVLHAVQAGAVNTADADTITWLPRERWLDRMY